MSTRTSLLTTVFSLLLSPLWAANVSTHFSASFGAPLALSAMNLGVDAMPTDEGAGLNFNGINSQYPNQQNLELGQGNLPASFSAPINLERAAPNFTNPVVMPQENVSVMPLNPPSPLFPPSSGKVMGPNGFPVSQALSSQANSRFEGNLKRRALSLQNPLKNLALWSLGGSKNSAEKGRQLGDDLWRMVFGGKAQDVSQKDQNISSPQKEMTTQDMPHSFYFPDQNAQAVGAFQGNDPVVSQIGQIPAPDPSLDNAEISRENSLLDTPKSGTVPLNLAAVDIEKTSGAPALIFMRVARRFLDFSLFEKIGTVYRMLVSFQGQPSFDRWDFLEPTTQTGVLETSSNQSHLGERNVLRKDSYSAAQFGGDFSKGMGNINLENPSSSTPLSTIPNRLADLWLFLSFLPILVAALASRRAFF